ncbi:MAG: hypothetical protein HS109_10225 [Burkholderiales bacterium]|nr:hypothetical protein [Burkholderiales bacterium]
MAAQAEPMIPANAPSLPDSAETADWLERALADDAIETRAAHIDDAGFTAGVMAALPAPATVPRWRRPAEWALWGIASAGVAVAMPELVTGVAREMFRLAAQPVSLPHLAAALLAIGVATWGGAAYVLRRD